MNDENVCGPGRDTRDVQEVDVILSQAHYRLVAGWVRGCLILDPFDGRAVGCLEGTHIQREKIVVRERIWNHLASAKGKRSA